MSEADDDFVICDAATNVGLSGCVGRCIAPLDFKGYLVGSAMLGAFERADGACNAGVHIGSGSGDDAGGECGCVEFVLGVEDERDLHGAGPLSAGRGAVEQMKKMRGDGIAVRPRPSMRLPLRA